jgi:hypothetical protein
MGAAAVAAVRYPSPLTLPALRNRDFGCRWRALFQIRAILLALALLLIA